MNVADVRSALHVYELEREFVYVLDLPAGDLDEVEVRVTGNRVTVSGGVDADPEFFGKTDRPSTAFRREIALSDQVDVERLEAARLDGVLELHAPKLPHPPPTRKLSVHRRPLINSGAAVD